MSSIKSTLTRAEAKIDAINNQRKATLADFNEFHDDMRTKENDRHRDEVARIDTLCTGLRARLEQGHDELIAVRDLLVGDVEPDEDLEVDGFRGGRTLYNQRASSNMKSEGFADDDA